MSVLSHSPAARGGFAAVGPAGRAGDIDRSRRLPGAAAANASSATLTAEGCG